MEAANVLNTADQMIIPAARRLAGVSEYYFAKKLRELRQRMSAGEDIINLGIGNPDMSPSDETVKRLISAAVEPHHHGYQPYKGIPALRQAYADWYFSTYGVTLDPESHVLPLIGSKEGIMHVSMAFLNPGDQVLIPNPGYPTYLAVTKLMEAEPFFYDLSEENGWKPDLEALAAQDLSRVKIMWINYPHMPSGAKASAEDFQAMVDFARKHRILLCHDNPYSLVLNKVPMSVLSADHAWEVAIELNSLSKSHNMAGWRIGMVAGAQAYVDTILRVKSNMDSGMFLPLQEAAVAALHNSYEWHRERNEAYEQRRIIAFQLLDSLGCSYEKDQVGMFVWAKTPLGQDGFLFSDQILAETLVFLTPGGIFGSQGNGHIRISLCTPKHRLEEALERILTRQLTSA